MATTNSQRIGIWVIAGVLLVGTLGSFIAMMLVPANEKIDTANAAAEQQQAAAEYAKAAEPLNGYQTAAFTAGDITELKKEVLVQGEGEVVAASDSVNVSYFGWLPDGSIFDSSTRSGTDTPINLALNGVITGWTEGIAGEKVGSTIKLLIPSEKAYGAQASGLIPANTPLAFILTIHSIAKAEK